VLGAWGVEAQSVPPGESGSSSGVPGRFDYYTLVLSWSPTYCASLSRDGNDPQCNGPRGDRYAFVLHGLWPQYERGFPLSCAARAGTFVPQPVIERMQDIMPNPKLTIHEYRTHGTCSGLEPAAYYELARRLFARINVPQRYLGPRADQLVATAELLEDFLGANPGLEHGMVAVACGGPGNLLKDVRFCFTRKGEPRRCGANEAQDRLCRATRVNVPPVRPRPATPG
jgi:ribonuclease T2